MRLCFRYVSETDNGGGDKGGDDTIKVVGNAWNGTRKCGWCVEVMNVMCGCQLRHPMDGVVKMMSSGVSVYGYRNDELKREIEDLKKKMECMKSIDEERKEASVYEGR